MSPPPTVRVNTYFKENDGNLYIDTISKIFIVLETTLGFNKFFLIGNSNCVRVLVRLYCISFSGGIIYSAIISSTANIVAASICVLQFIFCSVYTVLRGEKLKLYYAELNKFDDEVGCRPLINRNSLLNLLQLFVTLLLMSFLFSYPYDSGWLDISPLPLLPFRILYAIEGTYYGHLLGLLNPRLMLINHFIESSLSRSTYTSENIQGEYAEIDLKRVTDKLEHKDMKQNMNIYLIIVRAYENLVDAIKFQFMVIIILSFVTILGLLYHLSLKFLHSSDFMGEMIISYFSVALTLMAPMFSPCVFGENIYSKVKHLRELLASKLYENKLDKSGRSTARALLAITETRNLSFRLLRVLDIDVSLPFKFIALLITYLVILLQFDKIING